MEAQKDIETNEQHTWQYKQTITTMSTPTLKKKKKSLPENLTA